MVLRYKILAIFYAGDAMVASRCQQQLQDATGILVGLFARVDLHTHTPKTKVVICVPGKIRTRLASTMYASNREGLTTSRDCNKRQVKCNIFGNTLTVVTLPSHLETKKTYWSRVIDQDALVDKAPVLTMPYNQSNGNSPS